MIDPAALIADPLNVMKKPNQPRPGFTLVELLVVIAIIAVLSLIGFGVTSKVMLKARNSECVQTMREWSVVMAASAADNNGVLITPRNWAAISNTAYNKDTDTGRSPYADYWADNLGDCLRIHLEKRRCPCLAHADLANGNTSPSYMLNRRLSVNYNRQLRPGNLAYPGMKVLFIDAKSGPLEIKNASEIDLYVKPAAEKHGGHTNILYADYHIGAMSPDKLRDNWEKYLLPDKD